MTPKGAVARAAIVEAAWTTLEEVRLDELVASTSLRSVAAAADISPGALQHHFPNMDALASAMVEALFESMALDPVDDAEEGLALLASQGVAVAVRAAAQANWDGLTTAAELTFYRRFYRVLALAVGRGEAAAGLRAVLVDRYWSAYRPQVEWMLSVAIEASGRRLVEPFTLEDLATVAGSLMDGLMFEHLCRPDGLRSDLYADTVVAIASALTVPASRLRTVLEIAADMHERGVGGIDDAEMVAVAVGAAPLFADGYVDVGFASIVDAADVDVALGRVVEAFGTPRAVAAVSFCRHVGELRSEAERRRSVSVELALTDVVLELARRCQAEPWAATALVLERIEARAGARQPVGGVDVNAVVDLDAIVVDLMGELRPQLSAVEAVVLAELLVDTTLSAAAGRPTEALATLVARVLRLLPGANPDVHPVY